MSDDTHLKPFDRGDIYLFYLIKICNNVCRNVMHQVFCEGTSQRSADTNLLDYYHCKGIPVNDFKKTLESSELKKVIEDAEGKSFDVTLLYKCIVWGNDEVHHRNDPIWHEGSNNLESVLTTLKKIRDFYITEEPMYDAEQFKDEVKEIRRLLTCVIISAGERYKIRRQRVDGNILDMKDHLNNLLSVVSVPLSYEEYQDKNLFSDYLNYVKTYRMVELRPFYEKLLLIAPIPKRSDLIFKVDNVYTELELRVIPHRKGEEVSLSYDDLLKDIEMDFRCPVILVEGLPGEGKSFLTRKILSDWISGKSTMKNLDRYDFVLYAQCSNTKVERFDEFLRFLMPEMGRIFRDTDFAHVLLSSNVMVILDGLDEGNPASKSLYQDVIEMKRSHPLTVIITTRPTSVECYYIYIYDRQIKTNHIKIKGISQENYEKFVIKYYKEMLKRGSGKQSLHNLIIFLKSMKDHLGALLQVPAMLTLCAVLWFENPQNFNNCTSFPELYFEMLQVILNALLVRIRNRSSLEHIDDSVLKERMDNFLILLGETAIGTLVENAKYIPKLSYKQLVKISFREDLPPGEMLSAFLYQHPISSIMESEGKYTFPWEGLRDFLAAYALFKKVIKGSTRRDSSSVITDLKSELISLEIPENLRDALIRKLTEQLEKDIQKEPVSIMQENPLEETTLLRSYLKNPPGSSPLDVKKFQNVFLSLLGLFHREGSTIYNGYKLELITAIEETGVYTSDDWLRVLAAVRCDAFVSSHISEKYDLLEGDLEIVDSIMFAYIYLLNALQPPLKGQEEISIEINCKGQRPGIGVLINLINIHQLRVKKILITDENVNEYIVAFKNIKGALKESHPVRIDIRIMENVHCIDELFEMVNNHKFCIESILITDENVIRYTSVLKTLPPVIDLHGVNMVIDIQKNASNITELLVHINKSMLNVKSLRLFCEFSHPMIAPDLEEAINQIFDNSSVEKYEGKVNPNTILPGTLRTLYVNVPNGTSYTALHQFFQSKPMLSKLGVCIALRLDPSILYPLPHPSTNPPSLFLLDVNNEHEIKQAAEIARKLQPIVGDKHFYHIYFPRSHMSQRNIKQLIQELTGVSVYWCLVFPYSSKPTSPQEVEELQKLAKKELHCAGGGVEWGEQYGMDKWE